jgi:hypothetical protein
MNKAAASDTLLLNAVPSSLRADADSALLSLGSPELQTTPHLIQDTHSGVPQRPGILIEGQHVQIPYRVYYAWPEPGRTEGLNETQRLILSAWMTRDADGRTRQKALRNLLQDDAPWTIPYVIQLCGEYVVEIATDILQFLTKELPKRPNLLQSYRQFIADNPTFVTLTEQRALSYWNAYDRWRFLREDYPQLAALRLLVGLCGDSTGQK